MMGFLADLRSALRAQRRAPGTTVLIVATLGLGIGSSTAVFSALQTVLKPSYPFADPDRLVFIEEVTDQGQGRLTVPDLQVIRGGTRSMEAVSAFRPANLNLTGLDLPERVSGAYATAEFFDVLGLRPLLGHAFESIEESADGPRTVVLSHGIWIRLFSGDPGVLKAPLVLDGVRYTIVGILPEDFWFPLEVEVWLPVGADEAFTRPSETRRIYQAVGRLRAGVEAHPAQEELESLLAATRGTAAPRLAVTDMRASVTGNSDRILILLQAAAALLLGLGLANAAGMILARSLDRRRELLLRVALGARPGALARAALAEGVGLAAFGGFLGILIATPLLSALPSMTPVDFAGPNPLTIHPASLLFCVLISLVTGGLVSLVPALRAAREAAGGERGPVHRGTASRDERRVQYGLLTGQVMLALVLLIGAASVTRSLITLLSYDVGFRAEGVITMRLSLSDERYSDSESIAAFFREISANVADLPEVEATGVTLALPFSGTNISMPVEVGGGPAAPVSVEAHFRTVAAHYFEALQIPLLEGRYAFTDASQDNGREAVVSEALARQLGVSPIGMTLRLEPESDGFEIVGVVGDVRHFELGRAPEPEIYLGYESYPMNWGYLVARSSAEPSQLVAAIRRSVTELDSNQPVYDVALLNTLVSESTGQQRLVTLLVGVFAISAILIIAAGIYGLVAGQVARMTRELGVRAALGAGRRSLVIRASQGVTAAVLVGLALGHVGVFVIDRFVESWIFAAPEVDALSVLLASLTVILAASLAAYVPARRASRVDPVKALAAE